MKIEETKGGRGNIGCKDAGLGNCLMHLGTEMTAVTRMYQTMR